MNLKRVLSRAYFDGDGNFQNDKGHHQIRVCSRSEQMIKDVALLLNYFDIFGSIKPNFTRRAIPLAVGLGAGGSQPPIIYNLAISSKYATSYKQQIGSQVHQEKLDEIISYTLREDALICQMK